jgi:membrane protein implicated in regulation of membrane protease activity
MTSSRVLAGGAVGNWANWILVIGGMLCVIIELALGAATGLDLALVGASLVIGGVIGLAAKSAITGLLSAGGLSLVYLAIFRNWLKTKLTVKNQVSNADAVIGRTGVVSKAIGRSAGMVKLGDEVWRAELCGAEDTVRELGATVTVEAVEGVTLKVRRGNGCRHNQCFVHGISRAVFVVWLDCICQGRSNGAAV